MRRLRDDVAASLDGCSAGPDGVYDCIPPEPAIALESVARFPSGQVSLHHVVQR